MIHIQKPVDGWLDAVARLPAGSCVLAVDQVQESMAVKATNPDVTFALRHHYDTGQQSDGGWEGRVQRAREFFATFIDGTFDFYAQYVDFVLEFNEYFADSQTPEERAAWVDQSRAMAHVWFWDYKSKPIYSHIKLVLANTAVGNDIPAAMANVYLDYQGSVVMGYHPYTYWKDGQRGIDDWQFLSGRWAQMEAAWGVPVEWLFTEAGPFESAVTGWRSDECLGHDINAYVEAVRVWIHDCMTTPAYKEGRIHGFCLFTTGRAGSVWSGFWTEQPELTQLADMVSQEWKPGSNPPTPPTPPPDPQPERAAGVDVSTWQGQMNWTVTESAGNEFAFIRSSIGINPDVRFAENWANSTSRLYRAPYHYYANNVDPLAQAEYFSSFIMADAELPPVADIESSMNIPADHVTRVYKFLLAVEEHSGVRPMIYTSPGYWNAHIGNVSWASSYPLWIAHWTGAASPLIPAGFDDWLFWQWTNEGDGAANGANSNTIDLNRFNGTVEELDEYVSGNAPTLEQSLWTWSIENQVISLNPDAGLQKAIAAAGFVPVTNELRLDYGGVSYALQGAEHLEDGERRVWYVPVGEWARIRWTGEPG